MLLHLSAPMSDYSLCGQGRLLVRFNRENIPKLLRILIAHQFTVVLKQYRLGVSRLQRCHCSITVVGNVVTENIHTVSGVVRTVTCVAVGN